MTAIVVKNLNKSFQKGKRIALKNLNAEIQEGKITGIVGPDGAGKTTLLRIFSGLMTADSGECLIFPSCFEKRREEVKGGIGYLPQKLGLYDDLTVSQNLSLYSRLQGISKDEPHVAKLMEFSGLEPFQKRLVGELSGGMKQKLGLVSAMLRKPKLLLLDEPTVGVDPLSQNELWKMIQNLHDQKITVIVSTSYMNEAELCREVLVLSEGNLIFSGNPETFKDSVKGKTFFFENVGSVKREVLDQILGKHHIIDTIAEGENVKVTFDIKNPERDPKFYGLNAGSALKERKPGLEDAFISKLGGIPKRPALHLSPEAFQNHRNQYVIEAVNLTKKFGDFTAVKNVAFSIGRGEVFGLLGPNGAGKSTTFKMLCGLINPTEGEALVDGVSLNAASSTARGKIGYMAQKFSLYDNMTVLQNLKFFSGIYSVSNKDSMIQTMIEVFDLKDFLDNLTVDLPLGYKQRLALSCSLMHKPKILFLDEPTSGVDPLTRREFWHQINALAASGVAVLISTHLMDEAEFCDRIGLIHNGELRVVDTPNGLKNQVPESISQSPTLFDAFIYFCSNQ